MAEILVDTSFLVALNSRKDQYHAQSVQFVNQNEDDLLLPEVVLPEAAFLIRREGGIPAVLAFMDRLILSEATLQPLSRTDIARAREIMSIYIDARLDFVDCCIMALAERMHINRICTFDRRDFMIFRPAQAAHFELLP
ncbi:MAG: PIN domain-containing protein [Anaerolineae bacterium]|nr:PIN domain-containing protein [Anaerolineae bacterium]